MRVVVVPRWGGAPSDDWYPWAAAELEEQEGVALEALAMPDPAQPEIEAWIAAVAARLATEVLAGGARRPQRRLPRRARSG